MEKAPDQRYQQLDVMRREIVRARKAGDRAQAQDDSSSTVLLGIETIPVGSTEIDRLEPDVLREIDEQVADARRAFDEGKFEEAITACEYVLEVEPTQVSAAALLERARTAQTRRRVEEWLADASSELDRGVLTTAVALVDRAEVVSPSSPQILAVRALIEKERAARIVADARRRFADDDYDGALGRLAAHDPPSPVVTAAHEELQAEAGRRRRVADLVSQASELLLNSEFGAATDVVSQALAIDSKNASALKVQRQVESARRRYAEKLVETARRRFD